MFRTGASRAILRSSKAAPNNLRTTYHTASINVKPGFSGYVIPSKRPVALSLTSYQPKTALICRHASGAVRGTTQLTDLEEELAHQKLKPEPHLVSADSTIQPMIAPGGEEPEPDPMEGIRHDIKVIRETFALSEVPTEAYRIGMAGVLPYLATSSVTVACALELNHAHHNYGHGYLVSEQFAQSLLQFLEPIQIGYGATIISFLGAIHWGLEWGGYGGHGGYNRYAIGVIAPAVAWPTILLPVEEALITQFLTFIVLYAVDSHTTVKGWTPPWYSTYRFVLTAVVGTSIVITLIGRGQIQERVGALPSATQRLAEIHQTPTNEEEGLEQKFAEEEEES